MSLINGCAKLLTKRGLMYSHEKTIVKFNIKRGLS